MTFSLIVHMTFFMDAQLHLLFHIQSVSFQDSLSLHAHCNPKTCLFKMAHIQPGSLENRTKLKIEAAKAQIKSRPRRLRSHNPALPASPLDQHAHNPAPPENEIELDADELEHEILASTRQGLGPDPSRRLPEDLHCTVEEWLDATRQWHLKRHLDAASSNALAEDDQEGLYHLNQRVGLTRKWSLKSEAVTAKRRKLAEEIFQVEAIAQKALRDIVTEAELFTEAIAEKGLSHDGEEDLSNDGDDGEEELLRTDLSNDGEEQSPLKAIGKRTSGRHEKTSTAISK